MRSPLLLALMATSSLTPVSAQVALTVYNNDFAVVRETRSFPLQAGQQAVRFPDVAARIDATSVVFRSLSEPATRVLEQNFEFDLVNADKLLQKFIDQPVAVLTQDGSRYSGKLLAFDPQQIILQGGDSGVEGLTMVSRPDNVKDIQFTRLPEGLLTRPTLVWLVDSPTAGEQQIEVAYHTEGLSWEATYNAILSEGDTRLAISGWVTITNQAGATFPDATIKLMAGDVQKEPPRQEMPTAQARVMSMSASADAFEEKAFFEYHLYTLQRPSTLADNQVKQIELLTAESVAATKHYRFVSPNLRFYGGLNQRPEVPGLGQTENVTIVLEFDNTEANGLGKPLPAGLVRLSKRDEADDALEFIGEDRINHTPRNETLALTVGDAFDVVGERRQTDFRIDTGRKTIVERWEIEIRNRKETTVTVEVIEPLFRWSQWEIQESSMPFTKADAQTILFAVEVEPDATATVQYAVKYTW